MPDQEHLILVLASEAEEITRDMAVFFAPTRDVIEPGADWPPDLGPGEMAALIPQLRLTIGNLADVMRQIVSGNKADPDQAIREGETLFGVPASPPGTRPQQDVAARDFPHGAAATPATGTSRATPEACSATPVPPRPGSSAGPGTRHPC